MRLPEKVKIVEVGPRDGLQNESAVVSVAVKIKLIERLGAAGLTAIEAGSFVSPKWVPQMADTGEVLAKLHRRPGVRYPVLVPNMRGFEAARAAGASEIAVFTAASETFTRKNINCSIPESLERYAPVIAAAQSADIPVRGYISCALTCPYEGDIAPDAVAQVSEKLFRMGCYEISVGDTIGVAEPQDVTEIVSLLLEHLSADRLALHLHDTRGRAVENAAAGLALGIRTFDGSAAGLGGCPFAPGAPGNLATETLVAWLHAEGLETGIDEAALAEAAAYVRNELTRGATP